MIIKNNNGEFQLNASHYNWLTHHIVFNDIDSFIVDKTSFINSTWEYDKASELLVSLISDGLISKGSIRYIPCIPKTSDICNYNPYEEKC